MEKFGNCKDNFLNGSHTGTPEVLNVGYAI